MGKIRKKLDGYSSWVGLMSLLFILGCDETPKEVSSPKYDMPLPEGPADGPSFDDEDFNLRVEPPEKCPSKGVLAPAPGMERLAIPVEITSKSAREIPVGPMLFSLRMKGQAFQPTLASCKDAFKTTTLGEDDSIRAYVAFDLPQHREPLELWFEPFLVGRKKVTARARVPALP